MSINEQVWLVDDDSSIRWVLEKALQGAKLSYASFSCPESLWQALSVSQPRVIVSDIQMPKINGLTLLERIQQHYPDIPVIIITAYSDLDSTVNAYQAGAFEYLPKPFDIDEALALIERALVYASEHTPSLPSEQAFAPTEIIGEAQAMQAVFRTIGRLSRSSVSVLIKGDSGTGKELVAGALHKHSPRKDKPFIALNMAAIPKDLIESELFGHEKGAFTGANQARHGRFEQANGGTLFLDEIGDMPIEIQTRLLRVLAEGQFYRVGGHSPVQVDVRIIAATHQQLDEKIQTGEFREDLFHRLNVIQITLPPLSQRRDDIPQLAKHFLQMAAQEIDCPPKTLLPETEQVLSQCPWPGNVRQLENTCRWLTVMASGNEILPLDLPPELQQDLQQPTQNPVSPHQWQQALKLWAHEQLEQGESDILTQALSVFEQTLLEAALSHTQGHKQEAAKKLGWGRNTLTRKLKELDL